jgi:two-component system, LytTR family, response regulator
MKKIIIPTNKGAKIVLTQDIIRVQASSSYSKVYFSNEQPLTVAKVLHWFEEKLPEDFFYRIHQTHIINRSFVKEVSANKTLKLTTGEQIQVSRGKKNTFILMMEKIAAE